MNIVYDTEKREILGRRYLLEAGNVSVDKIIYRPTLERFNNFYNIMKTKSWYSKYNFIVVGSFSNIMNNNKLWETWDIDINVSCNSNDLNYEEIKNMLNECSRIALEDCDFYLEIYFNLNNDFPLLHVNDYKDDGVYTGICYSNKLNILSHLLHVKRDNKIVTQWPLGKEVIKGLWKRSLDVPSEKQLSRRINGLFYDPPIDIKKYFK